MRAIRKTRPGEGNVVLTERDRPEPKSDEVLLETAVAGVCGTDAHIYDWNGYDWIQTPVTLGHEFSGVVWERGSDVETVDVGELVTVAPMSGCGTCYQCRIRSENVCPNVTGIGVHEDGGMAEFVTVGQSQLHPIPESVGPTAGALTEPTAIAVHAVSTRGSITSNDRVLVQGVGPIGLLTACIVGARNPRSVLIAGTDADEAVRFSVARDLGFETINVEQTDLATVVNEQTDGRGVDHVFDATGHPAAFSSSISAVRNGGTIVVIGTPSETAELDVAAVVRSEIDLLGSYSAHYRDFEEALQLLKSNIPVDSLIESYPIEEPTAPFEEMLASEAIKPVFEFGDV